MKRLFSAVAVLGLLSMPVLASEPFGFVYQNTTHQLLWSGSVNPAKVGTATYNLTDKFERGKVGIIKKMFEF